MKIYLAGPIRGLTYGECTEWRDYASRVLKDWGHVPVSPMRGKEYLEGAGPLLGDSRGDGSSSGGSYDKYPMSSEQGIWGRDTFDVKHCDAILANFEGATQLSIGTCMEIQRGYDLDKYVLVVVEPGAIHDHPFIRRAASLFVPTLNEALVILRMMGLPYAN